jgi:chromosome segregation ATPase
MTTLGKVLAILNLVLSVFVGALIVMSYVARTNWHTAYVDVERQARLADADRKAYFEETVALKDRVAKAEQDSQKANQDKEEAGRQHDAAILALNQRLSGEARRSNGFQGSLASMTSELERRQREVNYLGTLLAQRDDQLKTYEKAAEDARDRAVQEEMRARSEHQRNVSLLAKLEDQTKQLQKNERAAQAPLLQPNVPAANPPQADIAGIISRIDAQSGLVTIDIGSDAGLSKGNTLEVFRLNPEPKYLGSIEILAVRPNEAVAKQVGSYRSQLHVGDRVSSNILARR